MSADIRQIHISSALYHIRHLACLYIPAQSSATSVRGGNYER